MMKPFYEYKTQLIQVGTGTRMNFPPHLHLCTEILFLKRGAMMVTVGKEQFLLQQHGLVLVFPNQVHAYQTLTAEQETEYCMFICQQSLAGELAAVLSERRPKHPILSQEQISADALYALRGMEQEARGDGDPIALRSFFQLFLSRVLAVMPLCTPNDGPPADLAARMAAYVSEHFKEPLTLGDLAAHLGVSKGHLSRVFSKTIGISYYAYINSLRVDHAKQLLRSSRENILTVGFDCGFDSQQTFNRVFKSVCGATPREYRRASVPHGAGSVSPAVPPKS